MIEDLGAQEAQNDGNTEDSWLRSLSSNCQHRISWAGDSFGRAWNTNLRDNETEASSGRCVTEKTESWTIRSNVCADE